MPRPRISVVVEEALADRGRDAASASCAVEEAVRLWLSSARRSQTVLPAAWSAMPGGVAAA